jgi:glycosyltransferase involved in cell wall biosynthesis
MVARTLGTLGRLGTLGTLSAFACLTPETEYRFLPQKLASASRRNRWRNRLAAGLVRTIVTVSPSLGRGFCRYNRISLDRLRVVSYGVDIDRFTRVTAAETAAFRAEHHIPADAFVIASVGRLVEQKDYPTQLRAFAAARARRPGMIMLLVGDGPLRAELEALVRELGIADAVRFAGHRSDAPVALRAVDVYVIASKFEPYGVALLEAKAAGAAIVATSVNEIPEILGPATQPTGRLVPPEDPAAMAEAFVALADDPAGRRALGERAARDAAERHSLRAVIAAYQGLYDEARGLTAREVGTVPAF